MARLTDSQRKLLEWLAAPEQVEYEILILVIPFRDIGAEPVDIPKLKKRGLIDSDGRGNQRGIWITDAGKEALAG